MSPSAKLISWTPNPIGLVACLVRHNKFGDPLRSNELPGDWDLVRQLLKEDWCQALEFPVFVWQMVLPRSLHAQVRAHRHWSFFSQSNQVIDPVDFADHGDYYQIPGLNDEQLEEETEAMEAAQDSYRQLRKLGVLPALARGVLPQHIDLGLAVGINLRTLFQTALRRRCHVLQGTYWNPLLDQMRDELKKKVDPRLGELLMMQPCDVTGRCMFQFDQHLRAERKDPHAACPRWIKLVESDGKENCCGKGCVGCLKHARVHGHAVERSPLR